MNKENTIITLSIPEPMMPLFVLLKEEQEAFCAHIHRTMN